MFKGRANDHIAAVRSGHRAADKNDLFVLAHLHHLEVLHRHALVAEVTWHSLVLPNPSRRRTIANRTDAPMRLRTVRRALPMKVMFLHHTLKSFSLGSANHIHVIARLKLRNAQVDLAFGKITCEAKLAHKLLRLDSRLLELTNQCFRNAGFLLRTEPNLHRRVSLVFFSQTAQ